MMIAKIFALIGLAVIAFIAVIWIYKPWSNNDDDNNNDNNNNNNNNNNDDDENTTDKNITNETTKLKLTEIKDKIKSFYINEYDLTEDDNTNTNNAQRNTFEYLNQEKLREICLLGIKLLRNYSHDSSEADYLNATSNIIDQVLKKANRINAGKTFETDEEWELYIVDIPHLMAMYDLIAKEDTSNSTRLTQCYEYIKKVINSNMESTCSKSTRSEIDFIRIGTPYLLTNYKRSLKDGDYNNLYEQAKNNDNLKSLNKYLLYDDTDISVNEKYGILRKDGGAMLKNKIVNYSKYIELIDKIKYPDLYAAVYEILDVPGNLYNSAKVILNKVLHKDVLYFPFGLFSLKCEMLKKKYYWNLGSPEAITIMPSIGVGIYKTDKFMFSVRVQKKNIPICSIEGFSDKDNMYYGISVMQLRTILLAGMNYEKGDNLKLNDWDTLKNEPGIMAFYDDKNGFTHMLLSGNESTHLYSPKIIDNDDNYIGQIPEDNLMFWKNSYEWSGGSYILAKVKEYGVAHQNGIVIQYDVQSDSKKYQIHYNFENNYKDNFDTPVTKMNGEDNPQLNQTYYESANKNCNFKWSMTLKNKSSNVDLTCDFDNSKQTVTCGNKEYQIEIIKDNKYYLVKRRHEDYLIGSVSDEKEQSTEYNSQTWTRDEETLMYYKKSSSK